MRPLAAALVILTLLALGACASNAASSVPDQDALIADGRDIAVAECSSCHAVGLDGASPRADAPPFRTVLSNYRADVLEEELIAGIQVTHPMPEFQLNPQGTDALIAYIRSIQRAPD